MLEHFFEYLNTVLFVLSEGYIVLAPLLWLGSRFSVKQSDLASRLINNLGILLMFIALGYMLDRSIWYLEDIFFGLESDAYAAKSRIFGVYGYSFWIPIIVNFTVFLLLLVNRFRTRWWMVLLGIVVSLNWPLHELIVWYSSFHRDFLPAAYNYAFPICYKVVAAFIANAVICLFIISIPEVVRFIRKR
ncbi:MAG: hypothetical protein ACI8UQ_001226 [Bacteroidia bacterium]|jgi:hypothetical protein